jgi:hypothetical protein
VRHFVLLLSLSLGACARETSPRAGDSASPNSAAATSAQSRLLYVWAGDSARVASDFLAVIDAAPSSPTYGQIVGSVPTGKSGQYPHHTEDAVASNGHLLANGYGAGETWLFDMTDARSPKIVSSFGDVAGMNHPHSYWRLAGDTVLATYQYAGASTGAVAHSHGATATSSTKPAHTTGGLVLMTERGTVVRSGSAADTTIADSLLYPYSVLPVPALDRGLSTTTDMDEANTKATSKWVQLWRLSDLKLLRSIELPPGPRGDENVWTGEPRLLPDGRSAYVHTFMCGLYLVRDLAGDAPVAKFVHGFDGKNCGVPVLAGKYWLQTVPESHALLAMDISDVEHPREVARVIFGDDEQPHWIAMEPSGRRLVLNSGGGGSSNRVFLVNFDPTTGALAIDSTFRDAGATRPGVRLTARAFPHGFTGTAVPHGSVFSRERQ